MGFTLTVFSISLSTFSYLSLVRYQGRDRHVCVYILKSSLIRPAMENETIYLPTGLNRRGAEQLINENALA